jgi:hypothetical protein
MLEPIYRPNRPVKVALPSALLFTMKPVSEAVAFAGKSSLATLLSVPAGAFFHNTAGDTFCPLQPNPW